MDVSTKEHPVFERQGDDLITRRTISFPDAALGTAINIELIGGGEHDVPVEAGTQPGSIITVAGKGAPNVNGPGRGSLHIVVQVDVPQDLSREARQLLKQLRDAIAGDGTVAGT